MKEVLSSQFLRGAGVGREVGIAALDKETGQVNLIQVRKRLLSIANSRRPVFDRRRKLADLQTYIKTLHHLHLHYPSLVLVPDTFMAPNDSSAPSSGKQPQTTSLLVQCIQDEFPGVPVEPVPRKYWNEEAGAQNVLTSKVSIDWGYVL